MSMMRLFIGLEPSPDFRDALRALQERLRAAGIDGRYAEPSNLHLTLAFVGMWPENIGHLLPAVGEPFPIALSHVGVFPKARVLWAGVKPSAALDALAERVRRTLDEAAIPYDRQPFYPHITLARKPVVPDALSLAGDGDGDLTDVYIESVVYKGEHNEIILESDERKWLMLSDVDEQVATYVPLNFDFDKAKFEVVQDAEG